MSPGGSPRTCSGEDVTGKSVALFPWRTGDTIHETEGMRGRGCLKVGDPGPTPGTYFNGECPICEEVVWSNSTHHDQSLREHIALHHPDHAIEMRVRQPSKEHPDWDIVGDLEIPGHRKYAARPTWILKPSPTGKRWNVWDQNGSGGIVASFPKWMEADARMVAAAPAMKELLRRINGIGNEQGPLGKAIEACLASLESKSSAGSGTGSNPRNSNPGNGVGAPAPKVEDKPAAPRGVLKP